MEKGNKTSFMSIIFETFAELIIIFVAAAIGAIIGSGNAVKLEELGIFIILILTAIILKTLKNI